MLRMCGTSEASAKRRRQSCHKTLARNVGEWVPDPVTVPTAHDRDLKTISGYTTPTQYTGLCTMPRFRTVVSRYWGNDL